MSAVPPILPVHKREVESRAELMLTPDALYKLSAWFSPSYPVGAFAYSGGIESAVAAGDITDAATLQGWVGTVLQNGSAFSDAVFFARAHEAARQEQHEKLRECSELASAFASCKERQFETTAVGRAFLLVTQAVWPCTALDRLVALWDGPVAYPIVAGTASAGHSIPPLPALLSFVQASLANMISAGVRLIPLGQTDGQRIVAELSVMLPVIAEAAAQTALNEVGGATIRADIAGMHHETQHTRLFRS